MSAENRVSDERLAALLAHEEPVGPLNGSMSVREARSILTELQYIRSKPVAGVEVKPLEWTKSNVADRWTAQHAFGQFEINRIPYKREDGCQFSWMRGIYSEYFITIEDAKATAEADYRQRILSALSLPEQEPVAWEGYWPGAGSIDSVTRLTSYRPTMEKWKADEAEITPLYASPQPEAVITEEMVERGARALHANSKGKHNHFLPFEDLSAQRILWLREDALATLTAALKEA